MGLAEFAKTGSCENSETTTIPDAWVVRGEAIGGAGCGFLGEAIHDNQHFAG
jgi:hypothetical protein